MDVLWLRIRRLAGDPKETAGRSISATSQSAASSPHRDSFKGSFLKEIAG
jgi:hypothetical protein